MTLSEAARNKAAALKKAEALRKVFAASKPLLVLKFQVMRRVKGTSEPRQWKMEIVSASCLPQCLEKDPNKDSDSQSAAKKRKAAREKQNHKPLSTCACEVLWMGPAEFEVHTHAPAPTTTSLTLTPAQALMADDDDVMDNPRLGPGLGLGLDHVSVATGASGGGGAPPLPLLSTPVIPSATTNNTTTDTHIIPGGGAGSVNPSDVDVYPTNLTLGQTVRVKGKDVVTQGEIRFIGVTAFATGYWVGLELTSGVGKNDGSVMGQRYFDCNNNHNTDNNHDASNAGGAPSGDNPPRGLFVRAHQVEPTPTSAPTHPQMDTPTPIGMNVPPSQPLPSQPQLLPVGQVASAAVRPSLVGNHHHHPLPISSLLHHDNNAVAIGGIKSLVHDIHEKARPVVKTIALNEWISMGSTRRKNVLGSRSPGPRFTEQDQASIFLFPPVWRPYKEAEVQNHSVHGVHGGQGEVNNDNDQKGDTNKGDVTNNSVNSSSTVTVTHDQPPPPQPTQTPEINPTLALAVEPFTQTTSDTPSHGADAINSTPSLDINDIGNPSHSILSSQQSNHSHSLHHPLSATSKTASFILPDAEEGEWVPRNFDFRPYTGVMTSERGSKLVQTKRTLTLYTLTLSLMLVQEWQRKALRTPGSTLERRKRDARKLLLECEEEERRCMAVEELQMRRFNLANSTDEYYALTEEQLALNREFCRIVALVMRPTTTLSRLRFYMGVQLEGGGIRITSSDPAATTNTRQGASVLSRGMVDLVITLMLCHLLISRHHPHVMSSVYPPLTLT